MRGRYGPFGGFGAFGGAWDDMEREWFGRGPGGGHGPGRRVDRGDVRLLILSVLKDGPKHGYEIIREIEKRAQGAYVPSPGAVYPTLQMLEDMGYVRSELRQERRVYELTDEGRAYLAQNEESASQAWERFEGFPWRGMFPGFGTQEQRDLQAEMVEVARAMFGGGRIFRADAQTLGRVRDALRRARQEIDAAFSTKTL